MPLSDLEKNVLRTKGLDEAKLAALQAAGVQSKGDFAVIGDADTLAALIEVAPEVAQRVIAWALPAAAASASGTVPPVGAGSVVVESSDVVYCVHCRAKQPKDYSSGDLCPACGKQAEPILACFWCGHSGPGRFCRSCGGQFVPTGEFELAVLLRRDGLPKDSIPEKLRGMSAAEKEALWGRVRKAR